MTQDRIVIYDFHDTKLDRVLIGASTKGLCWLSFVTDTDQAAIKDMQRRVKANEFVQNSNALAEIKNTVDRFIAGENIALPRMDLDGTDFQQNVWKALLGIPRGKTVSYKDIAHQVGAPRGARAIGGAVGANPVSLFIPCHRVLTSDGKIGGYAWGIERKKEILKLEDAANT